MNKCFEYLIFFFMGMVFFSLTCTTVYLLKNPTGDHLFLFPIAIIAHCVIIAGIFLFGKLIDSLLEEQREEKLRQKAYDFLSNRYK